MFADFLPTLCWLANGDGYIVWYNRRWHEYCGTTPEQMEGWGWQSVHHPDVLPEVLKRWQSSIARSEPFEMTFPLRGADGVFRPFLTRVQPVRDASGRVARWFGVNTDVSGQLAVEQELTRNSANLEVLNRTGEMIAAELNLDRLVNTVTDAGVTLTGAQFGAFFYNVTNEAGEALMLYALVGAERAKFDQFGMPRATAVFKPTFDGDGVIRSDDILQDERYGKSAPHHGMPKGHLPVRSYLAAPVTSRSGEVIGGLFFGHETPGVFTEAHERLVTGLAGQAAVAIDNARLFQSAEHELGQRRAAEAQLQSLNLQLEERVAEEVAERTKAEEALRQAQKMEAVGQLTGGIAHDFNNMLAVVIGSLDIAERRLAKGDADVARYLENVRAGATRASALTQRLLAFSRQQPLAPQVIDLNRLVTEMSELLRRTLGEQVDLETVVAGGLWLTSVDPHQLESAIVNLAVNARDAMPAGGSLTIETANAYLDDRYAEAHVGLPAGQYVMIAVTDTGEGMPPETLAKVFDPFFTTKPVGKGTGLGLSMVYGFVKQSGGNVKIYTELGRGTTVKLYLPRYLGPATAAASVGRVTATPAAAGGETILVVEDDPQVRQMSVQALIELGYTVLQAASGDEALAQLRTTRGIDLLFTDVVMAGMSGRQLADEVLREFPGIKVLFTTGYTKNAVVQNGVLEPGVAMIAKPFSISDLAQKVRAVLDS